MAHSTENIKQLLKDVVLIKLLDAPDKISSVICIPDSAKHKSMDGIVMGRVLDIGSKFRFKNEIHIGDIVVLPKHFGNKLNWDDETIRLFDGEDILAKVCS